MIQRIMTLPPFTPIEQALSTLKAHLRKLGARSFTEPFGTIGDICDLFNLDECRNFYANAGYAST